MRKSPERERRTRPTESKKTLYAGIDKVRFKNAVKPGDLCEVTTKFVSRRGPLFFFNAKLEVDGKLCCKGELSFALVPVPAEEKQ